jgi:hypothetical protein
MENPFKRDAKIFLVPAFAELARDLKKWDFVRASVSLALGMERVTKGILWDVNPLFTLKEPAFKHSAQVLYKSKFVGTFEKSDALAASPDSDTITLRESILRASLFSLALHAHRGILYEVLKIRDIAAHCDLELLEPEDLHARVYPKLGVLVEALWNEGLLEGIAEKEAKVEKLLNLGEVYAEEAGLKKLLAHHKTLWSNLPENEQRARREKGYSKMSSEGWVDLVTCPACAEKAALVWVVDYDVADGQPYATGAYVDHLFCKRCELRIDDVPTISDLGFPIDMFELQE